MWYHENNGRFIVKEHKGVSTILVDKETGVNYLLVKIDYGVGLTVMVDADGKPIITPVNE